MSRHNTTPDKIESLLASHVEYCSKFSRGSVWQNGCWEWHGPGDVLITEEEAHARIKTHRTKTANKIKEVLSLKCRLKN